ncbi:MAG: response regulator, partial [Bdellovibrio sp.]
MGVVLVVDDDPAIPRLVKAFMYGTKYQVLSAKDAFEADEILNKYRVSLLLVDINMPYKNGFDFVQQLKRNLRGRLIPTVFMTARSDRRDIERAASLKVDGYIIKPFTRTDLVKKVDELFKKGQVPPSSYEAVNVQSMKLTGELYMPFQFEMESVSELGVTILCNQKMEESTDPVP